VIRDSSVSTVFDGDPREIGSLADACIPGAHLRHPWWNLCLQLDSSDPALALLRLQGWEQQGIPLECVDHLKKVGHERAKVGCIFEIDELHDCCAVHLSCFGISLLDWQAHAWLQRCRLPVGFQLTDQCTATRVSLNLAPLEHWLGRPGELLRMAEMHSVWDPDPTRVAVFLALGIPAFLLTSQHEANGWLDRHDDAQAAMVALGLPHPISLLDPDAVLVLGRSATGDVSGLHPPLHGWPGFDQLQIADEDFARLLAHWLEHCSRLGIQIVRLSPTQSELDGRGFESFTVSKSSQQLPAQYFHAELDLSILSKELSWRRAGRPAPLEVHTPQPETIAVWEAGNSVLPLACVCISLFNYQDYIVAALDSVKGQTEERIELIVVDDASSDQSLSIALRWLEQHQQRFPRILLAKHSSNSGLAAARNTAFRAASSDWCFVLDADNSLHPQAVERCLRVANHACEKVAVVHPLIERVSEQGLESGAMQLISGLSWQRDQFLHGNYVDAMALVRRSAWQAVGGYSHIEDGWEDYDFWCKLIESDFSGVLCPQVLATYHCHPKSMIASRTDRNVRQISRTLQARHPWLGLPMAAPDA